MFYNRKFGGLVGHGGAVNLMNQLKHRGWYLLCLFLPSYSWAIEAGVPPSEQQASAALKHISEIGAEMRRLGDWKPQADLIDAYMDKLWASQGWTSDADVFAKNVMREVSRTPPWQFQQRMEKLTGMVGDRYQLDAAQRARFESTLYRETFGMFFRHADLIVSQTREIVSARVMKRAFTPVDIARWTRESEHLLSDALSTIDRIGESMQRDMTDAQREIMRKDNESFRRRMEFVMEQRRSWANGEWTPGDWGLEHDPIQTGGKPERSQRDARLPPIPATRIADIGRIPDPMSKPAKPARPENESTWARFVRLFVAKHGLDAGQRTAIYSILAELESRAGQYRQGHHEQLTAIPTADRATSGAYAPIRDMFEELKARAEALMTNTQRALDDR